MSTGFEITGKLIEKFNEVVISDKFKKREFVIETSTEGNNGSIYTELIKFQLVQDNCEKLNYSNVGDNVEVKFNLKGRKWEKEGKVSYFNSLDAWFIKSEDKAGGETPPQSQPTPTQAEPEQVDALPF